MKYQIKTRGLHCGHCDASVEAALLKVAGVTDAENFAVVSIETA